MTPPPTIIGALSRGRVFRQPARRRTVFAALVLICALLTFFPERHRAAMTMTPTDPNSLGLSGALGQLGALNTVFGNQAAVEVSLKVARGVDTRRAVIQKLGLIKRLGFENEVEASRWLEKAVDIRSLRGGIVQIECINADPVLAQDLVTTFSEVLRVRLSDIGRRQTAYKRQILVELVDEANKKLAHAETTYNNFRLTTRYSDPGFAISAIGERIPVLQAAIKVKEVELNAAREFATDDNMSVRQIIAQVDSLKKQLAQLQARDPKQSNSIGLVVQQSTRAEKLERDLELAKRLYYNYRNFLEGTLVEDLTSAANIRILETPFIDTKRQLNLMPLSFGILIIILALAIEFYQMRPPVGEPRE